MLPDLTWHRSVIPTFLAALWLANAPGCATVRPPLDVIPRATFSPITADEYRSALVQCSKIGLLGKEVVKGTFGLIDVYRSTKYCKDFAFGDELPSESCRSEVTFSGDGQCIASGDFTDVAPELTWTAAPNHGSPRQKARFLDLKERATEEDPVGYYRLIGREGFYLIVQGNDYLVY